MLKKEMNLSVFQLKNMLKNKEIIELSTAMFKSYQLPPLLFYIKEAYLGYGDGIKNENNSF